MIKSRNICYTRYPENYDTLLPWLPVLNAWEGNIRNSQLTVSLGKNVTLHSPTLFISPSRYRLSRTKAYCSLVPSSNKINQFHPISLYLSRVQNLTDTKAFINDTEGTFEGTSETYEGTVCYLLPSNLQVSIFETYLFIIMLSY